MKHMIVTALITLTAAGICAQNTKNKFQQLKEELPTPNVYRTASGAPGHEYYQQQADYDIQIELDDEKQRIYGTETVTYHNNSPDVLSYIWLQLDQNRRSKDSDTYKIKDYSIADSVNLTFKEIRKLHLDFDGGLKIDYVKNISGRDMSSLMLRSQSGVNARHDECEAIIGALESLTT